MIAVDSARWDARYEASELVWSAEPNQWVAAELAELAPARALDLAAGEARNAIWLAGLGWQVTAVDFSAVGLAKGKSIADSCGDGRSERISWLGIDLLDYVPQPRSYDLAMIVYLQVVADQRRIIVRRAAEALRPGGILLVVGHDTSNLTDGVGGPQDASVLFTADDICSDVAASDRAIRIDKAGQVRRVVPGEQRQAIDALVRITMVGD
jgi:SAM-dependent methyltransferase